MVRAVIDTNRNFPYAHALGMLLAIRLRWRLDEHADHVPLTGENLLRLAGIRLEKDRPGRTWEKLRRSLDALQHVRQIDRYTWTPEARCLSPAGVCRLYAADWNLDRTARSILPDERAPDKDRPVNGAELKRWRTKKEWSQGKTAERLKVQQTTISRAEARPDEPLGHKLRAAFENRLDLEDPKDP